MTPPHRLRAVDAERLHLDANFVGEWFAYGDIDEFKNVGTTCGGKLNNARHGYLLSEENSRVRAILSEWRRRPGSPSSAARCHPRRLPTHTESAAACV